MATLQALRGRAAAGEASLTIGPQKANARRIPSSDRSQRGSAAGPNFSAAIDSGASARSKKGSAIWRSQSMASGVAEEPRILPSASQG